MSLARPRLLPPRALLLALAAQLPLLVVSFPLQPPAWAVAAGISLITTGAILNIWAERLFRRDDVGVCPFTHVPVLVSRGPYRITRNPMYLGLVCIDAGVALVCGVPANLWSAITLLVWVHHAFVLPEEVFLRQKLGADFEAYAHRVPRWVFARGITASLR